MTSDESGSRVGRLRGLLVAEYHSTEVSIRLWGYISPKKTGETGRFVFIYFCFIETWSCDV